MLSASCCSAMQCKEGKGQVLNVGDHLITECLWSPVVLPTQKHPWTCASMGGHSMLLKIFSESGFYWPQITHNPAPGDRVGFFFSVKSNLLREKALRKHFVGCSVAEQ